MKHIEFKTSKGKFILIELDENLIKNVKCIEGLNISGKINCLVELVGGILNITEEQAKGVVGQSINTGLFAHYVKDVNPPNLYNHKNALPSLFYLIESVGVVFDNMDFPYGKPYSIDYAPYCMNEGGNSMIAMRDEDWQSYEKDLEEWNNTQSKVWNKQQTYLFKKI